MKENKRDNDHILTLVNTGLKFQKKLKAKIESELSLMPEGSIYTKVIKGSAYYYHAIKEKSGKWIERMIKPNEEDLKKSLLKKRYLKGVFTRVSKNIPLMDAFVSEYGELGFHGEDASVISELVYDSDEVKRWRNEPYKRKNTYLESLKQTTVLGLHVRSKSEALIAGLFETNGIAFRYEAELVVGEKTYYPDFTILCPSGKLMYWEHFGLMGDDKYKSYAQEKASTYFNEGFYPYDNLILSYDKEDGSIDMSEIQNLIDLVLLKR